VREGGFAERSKCVDGRPSERSDGHPEKFGI